MRLSTLAAASVGAALLLAGAGALGQERVAYREHTGSLGAFVALGGEYSALVVSKCAFCSTGTNVEGFDAILDAGGTLAVGQSGSELLLRFRLVFLSHARGESVLFGYRKYFGRDDFKTFASFDLMGTFEPVLTVGARAGFGVIWDFSSIMGLWVDAAATFGVGQGRRFGAELNIGFQARTYLFE
jgi:hypothetical protein